MIGRRLVLMGLLALLTAPGASASRNEDTSDLRLTQLNLSAIVTVQRLLAFTYHLRPAAGQLFRPGSADSGLSLACSATSIATYNFDGGDIEIQEFWFCDGNGVHGIAAVSRARNSGAVEAPLIVEGRAAAQE